MKRYIKTGMFFLGIAAIIGGNIWKIYFVDRIAPTESQLLEVITNSHIIKKWDKGIPHYRGFLTEKKEKVTGIAYITTYLEPKIKGFVDEIDVLVGMDMQGKITGVKLLSHKETPSYMNTVLESNFLEGFVGLKIEKGHFDVDTVTSATISSKAILEDIYSSSAHIARSVLGINIPGDKKESKLYNFFHLEVIIFSFILLLALISFLLKRYKIIRDISLISSVLVLGVYCNTFIYLGNITNLLSLRFPSVSNPNLFILTLFILITTPLLGAIFCSHLCPFGSMQEFIYRLFPRRWHVSYELWKRFSNIKLFLLFFCIIMIYGVNMDIFVQVEPFPYLFSWLSGSTEIDVMWLYIGGTLLISAFFNRFYCRIFCPTGVCLSIIAKLKKGNFKGYGSG